MECKDQGWELVVSCEERYITVIQSDHRDDHRDDFRTNRMRCRPKQTKVGKIKFKEKGEIER